MKRLVVIFLAVAALVWGVSYKLTQNKKPPGDKYIGSAAVSLYDEVTKLSGRPSARCYLDTTETYDLPEIATFTDVMPRFTQSAAEFSTAASTTSGTGTTTTTTVTTAESGVSSVVTTAGVMPSGVSDLEIRFAGDLLEKPLYTVFDSDYQTVSDPKEQLRLPDKKGIYYVNISAKWGKKKNYTKMEYYFILEVVD